jgi:hypothetical protein
VSIGNVFTKAPQQYPIPFTLLEGVRRQHYYNIEKN